jgi:hypothetical protein
VTHGDELAVERRSCAIVPLDGAANRESSVRRVLFKTEILADRNHGRTHRKRAHHSRAKISLQVFPSAVADAHRRSRTVVAMSRASNACSSLA